MSKKFLEKYIAPVALAAGVIGEVALTGCSASLIEDQRLSELQVTSAVYGPEQAHFGLTGEVTEEERAYGLASHMQLNCVERGILPPRVTVRAHTLVGNRQRHETTYTKDSVTERPCSDYLRNSFAGQAVLDEFSTAYSGSLRELGGDGYLVKEVNDYRQQLLATAAAGEPM